MTNGAQYSPWVASDAYRITLGDMDPSPIRHASASPTRRRPVGTVPFGSHRPERARRLVVAALVASSIAALTGCGIRYDAPESPEDASAVEEPGDDPQLVFWSALESLCGQAFEGQVVESVPPDESFAGRRLVMHVRSCETAEIRIPFFVGDDRSRTWVITPTAAGLRLEHDHRHEDGTEDEISRYGGETRGRGTSTSQDFHADRYTAELVPAAAMNVWTIEFDPGRLFAYSLRREGSDRRFRAEFDLTVPVPDPGPSW